MEKLRVAILYGGKSAEHDVSILSAMQIFEAIDREKFDPIPILIGRDGKFAIEKLLSGIDVVFPVLHGPFGEDGSMQGFLEILGLPYVGCGVASSAIAMDKELTKKILCSEDLPTARYLAAKSASCFSFDQVKRELGLPFFLKPVHLGSSVGIEKIEEEAQFLPALQAALAHDCRVIFEEFIEGREVECAILGNKSPRASLPGEIVLPQGAYYDFSLKTSRSGDVGYSVPADLQASIQEEVKSMAIRAFQAIGGRGMARVDFFLLPDGRLYVNEINPIPGFTKTSLYPQMWEASGYEFKKIISELIYLANSQLVKN
ncbi:MAG: D-alanine--D-alanine ligase family protein [Candidatus Algichlamydia australiensis]|nr:D-alanine--D-alanine ligase family protein [Chlamydiales bacterium]